MWATPRDEVRTNDQPLVKDVHVHKPEAWVSAKPHRDPVKLNPTLYFILRQLGSINPELFLTL